MGIHHNFSPTAFCNQLFPIYTFHYILFISSRKKRINSKQCLWESTSNNRETKNSSALIDLLHAVSWQVSRSPRSVRGPISTRIRADEQNRGNSVLDCFEDISPTSARKYRFVFDNVTIAWGKFRNIFKYFEQLREIDLSRDDRSRITAICLGSNLYQFTGA